MNTGQKPGELKLTEEEAYALLSLCLTSTNGIDALSERALRKLAEFCTSSSTSTENHIVQTRRVHRTLELVKAGA